MERVGSMDIFQQIENQLLTNINRIHKKYSHWILPRQCGATTYLISKATELVSQNKRVAFFVYNKSVYRQFSILHHSNVSVFTPNSKDFIGRQFDWVLIDTPGIYSVEGEIEFRRNIQPLIDRAEYTLRIETTD